MAIAEREKQRRAFTIVLPGSRARASFDWEIADFRCAGESWMDKEISTSQLAENQVGWDWFSLQLDDDRDLMLYLLRRRDGATDFRHATLVRAER